MSRAFVNEDQAAAQAEQPVERQISDQPNYVTPQGFAELQAKVALLHSQHSEQHDQGDAADQQRLAELERDLRYFTQRPGGHGGHFDRQGTDRQPRDLRR